jgi:hypothetical protein
MAILKGNRLQGGYVQVRGPVQFIWTEMNDKNNSSVLRVYGTPNGTIAAGGADGLEMTQGAAKIEFYRGAGFPVTSDWGGAEDMGCRINVGNYADNGSAYGGMKGLRVYARQYSGGSIANIYGLECSVDDRGTADETTGHTFSNMYSALITSRVNGVCGTSWHALIVEDNSQGSFAATVPSNDSMILLRTGSDARADGNILSAIHLKKVGTSITNLFSFSDNAGGEGFTAIADGTQAGNVNGYIKIYDEETTQTLYIPCYDAAPSA